MRDDSSDRRRVNLNDLNWLGKSVFVGGAMMRLTANLIDSTAERVTKIAAESKQAFNRELDPNIDEARVLEEYPRSDESETS